jgi:hypothetical protein
VPQSLNQITDELIQFGQDHGQLNTADFKAPAAWYGDSANLYPALFFDLLSARKVANEMAYTFEIYVVDRAKEGEEREVLSDAIMIAGDVLAFISEHDREYYQQGETQMTPFVDESADWLTGVKMEVTVLAAFPLDRCAIPYKPTITPGVGFPYTFPLTLS